MGKISNLLHMNNLVDPKEKERVGRGEQGRRTGRRGRGGRGRRNGLATGRKGP